MHREGAELAFTYQNDKLKGRVEEFARAVPASFYRVMSLHASIDALCLRELGKRFGRNSDGFCTPRRFRAWAISWTAMALMRYYLA